MVLLFWDTNRCMPPFEQLNLGLLQEEKWLLNQKNDGKMWLSFLCSFKKQQPFLLLMSRNNLKANKKVIPLKLWFWFHAVFGEATILIFVIHLKLNLQLIALSCILEGFLLNIPCVYTSCWRALFWVLCLGKFGYGWANSKQTTFECCVWGS